MAIRIGRRDWRHKLEVQGFTGPQIEVIRKNQYQRARAVGGIAGLLIRIEDPNPWEDMLWDGSPAHAKALDEYNEDHSMSDADTTIGRPF